MHNHMIERIAKVIDPDCFSPITDGCGQYWIGRRVQAKNKAKAVLQEMLDPTDSMVQAGIDEGNHKPGNWYPAMIQAALDEID